MLNNNSEEQFMEMVKKYGFIEAGHRAEAARKAATEAPTRKPAEAPRSAVEAPIEATLPDAPAVPSSALESPMGESVLPTLTPAEARTQRIINQQVQARCELMTWVRDMKKKYKGMRPALTKSELRRKSREWKQSYR